MTLAEHDREMLERCVKLDRSVSVTVPTEILAALLDELRHAEMAIHDLQQESVSFAMGVQQAAEVTKRRLSEHLKLQKGFLTDDQARLALKNGFQGDTLEGLLKDLESIGGRAQPDEVRRENQSLRFAMEQCLGLTSCSGQRNSLYRLDDIALICGAALDKGGNHESTDPPEES